MYDRSRVLTALLATAAMLLMALAPAQAQAGSRAIKATGVLHEVHGFGADGRESGHDWLLTTRARRRLSLDFGARRPPKAGSTIRVRGRMRSGKVRVTSVRVLRSPRKARASAVATGPRKTAVVMFNFSDDRRTPFTHEQVRSQFFTGTGSADAYLREASDERVSLTGVQRTDGDVFGWYPIDSASTTCHGSSWDWYSKADAAVAAEGGSLDVYDHVVYVHPYSADCGYAGIASVGGGFIGLNEEIELWVTGHELGHNLGLHHAGKLYCTDASGTPVPMSSTCTRRAYEDPYDIMGNRFQRHFSLTRQVAAGWIPLTSVPTATADGTFTLGGLTDDAAPSQGLRIPTLDGRVYWL